MPKTQKPVYQVEFPLSVSAILSFLIVIALVIQLFVFDLPFNSGFDWTLFNLYIILVALLGVFWLILMVAESISVSLCFLYKPLKYLLFYLYYPMALLGAVWTRSAKEKLQTSFLAFQNTLCLSNYRINTDCSVLVLLPHCLQNHDCRIRITRTIEDCEECGKCDISSLKQLGKKHGISIGIANGGTLARKLVLDNKPDFIIAVACPRDLTDGVRDSWKYPVYAILNERPNGPCFDTSVCTAELEKILFKIK